MIEPVIDIRAETSERKQHLNTLLEKYQADCLILRRVSSFAWATAGLSSFVNTAATEGAASLAVTHDGAFLVTNNIEAVRLQAEGNLGQQPWEMIISPWYNPLEGLMKLISGKRLIADVPFAGSQDISGEISRLRANLSAAEGKRMRYLGHLCAEILSTAVLSIHPGMSEYELAAIVGAEAQKRAVQPIVNLVGCDERIYKFRHPLPTEKKMQRYALLVLSGRWRGLVCSISRLVHFGEIPAGLREVIANTAWVNAQLIAATRPGKTLGQILAQGQSAYSAYGYPGEWQQHHQGGAVGYEPREYLATPSSTDLVTAGQAYAWNPTIAGAKMEDTILIGEEGNEILTQTPDWPVEWIEVPGYPQAIPCALALQLDE